MATVISPIIDNIGYIFETELSQVREKIKSTFTQLIDYLKARENELLIQLDDLLASYLSYQTKLERNREEGGALEKTKFMLQNELSANPMLKSVHENFILQLNEKLKSIETPTEPKMVSFECNSNRMLAKLNKLGKLVEKVITGIDYESKKQPLVSVCERGSGNQQLHWPRGVTVDNQTGNIYIADQVNNCIKVFDSTGEYLFKFGDNILEGKMYYPRGVAICGDRILITQANHCILNYKLNGVFICQIGTRGNGESEFTKPYSLTIDKSNGDIYICDSGNNRIQILSDNFSFKSEFGRDTLNSPRDIQLSKAYIFVLDKSVPCLHLFGYNHIIHKSFITRGIGMQVVNPLYFFLDHTGNILISDPGSSSIRIFNSAFQLSHKIPVITKPTAVTVDRHERVIVVCQAESNCLQIF